MTANLTPEYMEADKRFHQAKSLEEKIAALKEMMMLVPKHKGTERMRVELKKRLSKLQDEAQKKPKVTRTTQTWEHIDREGAGQVVLAGLPNTGKSMLLATVTNAQPEVADYPFSTFRPTVGMMPFEDIQIQLIDLPPLSEFTESWVFSLIRQADVVALLVDLSQPEPAEDVMTALGLLEKVRIQKTLLLATKLDAPGGTEALQALQEIYGEEYRLVPISAQTHEGLDIMKRALFELLEIVRVYTKKPGQSPSKESPHVLPQGSTITQVAKSIHHDLVQKLQYARLWGSAEFPGQRVERDHVVRDGDIIEIHA